jgi:hypothetical protein
MKKPWLAIIGLGLISTLFLAAQDLVKVEASIVPLRLSRGQEGKVILRVSLKSGIGVSAQPSFVIEFDPSDELIFPKNFFTASDLNIEVVEDGGKEYLQLKKPVEISFAVSPKAARGVHTLEGRVKYFATSAKDGWCLKSTARFSARYSTNALPLIKKFP